MVAPPEERRATATGNMHKNLVKIGRVVPEICSRTDKHTDRQTDTVITILRRPTRGEVVNTDTANDA